MPPPPGQSASPAYRILQGETISVIVWSSVAVTLASSWRIQYDDGSDDRISTDAFTTGTARAAQYMLSNQVARMDGYVTEGAVMFEGPGPTFRGQTYIQALVIMNPDTPTTTRNVISCGYVYSGHAPALGEREEPNEWELFVFQGTVAEDATPGTHICTLTVTPGAGNEILLKYGSVLIGNTATAQVTSVHVTDGTNILYRLGPSGGSTTSASLNWNFPEANPFAAGGNGGAALDIPISGTMQLVLSVSTAAISVTQTFAVVLRVRGAGPVPLATAPTATLADTVGTPTLTVNTNAFVGPG